MKSAVSYEAAFEADVWIFYDYTSLFQFERFSSEEQRSFKAAMDNMHVMYSHECTLTFRIESLTLRSVWESMVENDQELVPVWDVESQSIKEKPLKSLVANDTEYSHRGWCKGEISWSSLRTFNVQNQRIDHSDDKEADGDGFSLNGRVALTPDKFSKEMEKSAFTHRDDAKIVIELQEKIFEEKVAVCEDLVLKDLPGEEILALADALPLYKSLKTLKIVNFDCTEDEAELFGKETSDIV